MDQLSRFRTGEAIRRLFTAPRRNAATALILAAIAAPAFGQGMAAAPGPNEIRIGNTMPYTGPASAYGVIGKVMAAYFDKVNAEGGIKGRKINFISYDDAYNPTKTMEATRKLVEEDNVLFILASLGTNTSQAVHPYLNSKKIPQLFVASGASMWDQPREFPWTMGFLPSYQTEAHIYSQYLLENHPRSKIAVLYQDDGFGKDYVKGLRDGLGGKIPIVAEASYKVTDTTIDAQMAKLKASGADIFMQFTTPKFATMAIKRNAELGCERRCLGGITAGHGGDVHEAARRHVACELARDVGAAEDAEAKGGWSGVVHRGVVREGAATRSLRLTPKGCWRARIRNNGQRADTVLAVGSVPSWGVSVLGKVEYVPSNRGQRAGMRPHTAGPSPRSRACPPPFP
jgi:ABC-type branched-subunit amino acid transport system substrate-binding protein